MRQLDHLAFFFNMKLQKDTLNHIHSVEAHNDQDGKMNLQNKDSP